MFVTSILQQQLVVGAYWRTLDVIRGLPRVSNKPPTQAQLNQRIKFGLITKFLARIGSLVDQGSPGNVFGIYFPALKRIAHCGLVERVKGEWVFSIEANTNIAGSREGDGVHRRMRHRRTIRCYADWIPGNSKKKGGPL